MATLTKGKTFINGELVTPQKIHELVDFGTVTEIVNTDIAAGAGIVDTKLATIATAGKVANTATTATSANTASAIVARDASGNFSAGTITAALSGNAATATKLQTARTIALTGGVTGSGTFDGSGNLSITTAVASASGGTVTNVTGTSPISVVNGTSTPSISLGTVPIANGGTGSTTAAGALANLGGAASSHTHDDRYYTESEVNTLLAGKQDAGGSVGSHTHPDATTTAAGFMSAADKSKLDAATNANTANAIVRRDALGDIAFRNSYSWGEVWSLDGTNYSILQKGLVFVANQSPTGTVAQFSGGGNTAGYIAKTSHTSVIYATSSDYRLKTNLEKLEGAMSRLKAIPVWRFNWNHSPDAPKVDGFLSHEAQAIVPECVTGYKDEVDAEGKPKYQGIDQSKLVPLLVAAVQELAARVEALEAANS